MDTTEGRVDFHALRVTFATTLARSGAPLVLTQRLMRHSTPTLTANVYSKLGLDDARQAVAKVEEVFGRFFGKRPDDAAPESALTRTEEAGQTPSPPPQSLP